MWTKSTAQIVAAVLSVLAFIAMVLINTQYSIIERKPKRDVAIHMIDQNSNAVSGAFVRVGQRAFWQLKPMRVEVSYTEGITDDHGMFSYYGVVRDDMHVQVISSPDHYMSTAVIDHGRMLQGEFRTAADPFRVTLKQRINPIAMHARRVGIRLPSPDGAFAYDLLAGDLVRPHGTGTTGDIVLIVTEEGGRDGHFPGKENGVQQYHDATGSNFQSPYNAPISGYSQSFKEARSAFPTPVLPELSRDRYEFDNYYMFRIRSGDKALYGKIYRGFEANNHNVQFTYYLNTNGTTNLEYDFFKNTAPNLGPGEDPGTHSCN